MGVHVPEGGRRKAGLERVYLHRRAQSCFDLAVQSYVRCWNRRGWSVAWVGAVLALTGSERADMAFVESHQSLLTHRGTPVATSPTVE